MGGENELSSALQELVTEAGGNETDSKIKNVLKKIISEGSESELNIADSVIQLLANKDTDIRCLTARSIAELSKSEKNRTNYAHENIVGNLISACIQDSIDKNNIELMKQTCRALGNICCDSYVGRDLILKNGGVSKIVDLLPKTMLCNESFKIEADSLRLCVCKLLLNFLLGGSDYIKPALDAGFINNIHEVIRFEFDSEDGSEDCLSTSLLLVSVVLDNIPSLVLDNQLNLLVVEILKESKNIEISEMCLEHLHSQSEHDDVKTVLSSAAVPQLLWSLLEQHRSLVTDDETRQLMKLACDLIVLILTGDDSMHLLYADGKGEVYLAMIEWLDSDDVELVTTAVLAVGNFARTDIHCVYMMDSGVFQKLLSILSAHKSHEEDIRLQHAVLSGLRNLVIPQRNKPLAIEHGILSIILEMLPNVTQFHVVYKLLATLRMLVDGQESVSETVVSSGVLAQVCRWGARAEHAGAAGEAPRLLAWLVRQLHTRAAFVKLISIEGCVSCLVNMLVATHALMQNEAIVALTILCATCLLEDNKDEMNVKDVDNAESKSNIEDDKKIETIRTSQSDLLVQELVKADLGKQLNMLIETNIPKMIPEIAENICKFLSVLMKCKVLAKNLLESDVHVTLEKFLSERSDFNDAVKGSIENAISEMRCSIE